MTDGLMAQQTIPYSVDSGGGDTFMAARPTAQQVIPRLDNSGGGTTLVAAQPMASMVADKEITRSRL